MLKKMWDFEICVGVYIGGDIRKNIWDLSTLEDFQIRFPKFSFSTFSREKSLKQTNEK